MHCYVILWRLEELGDEFRRDHFWCDTLEDAVEAWLDRTGNTSTVPIETIFKSQ